MGEEIKAYAAAAPADKRVHVFQELANDAFRATRSNWVALRHDIPLSEGGGTIFYGKKGEAAVFNKQGDMFKARLTQESGHFKVLEFNENGTVKQAVPYYNKLQDRKLSKD